ncbi:hypothetical protein P7K49_013716 [Saguinus oedipus]|uniref:Uncharacterized protein n=1 Tax=Saguinus oedipus TaxID=9490 RepID=A0ABQ9VGQ3_SAGOE|nr:hypothetical protein P7K49_013716 [Saguinus oedipus]
MLATQIYSVLHKCPPIPAYTKTQQKAFKILLQSHQSSWLLVITSGYCPPKSPELACALRTVAGSPDGQHRRSTLAPSSLLSYQIACHSSYLPAPSLHYTPPTKSEGDCNPLRGDTAFGDMLVGKYLVHI